MKQFFLNDLHHIGGGGALWRRGNVDHNCFQTFLRKERRAFEGWVYHYWEPLYVALALYDNFVSASSAVVTAGVKR